MMVYRYTSCYLKEYSVGCSRYSGHWAMPPPPLTYFFLNKLIRIVALWNEKRCRLRYLQIFLVVIMLPFFIHVVITEHNCKGATILRFPGGGGWSFFEINNFGRTLREINNLLQELFYINM